MYGSGVHPAGDRSAAGGCLAMIYTVYKGVGLGIGVVAADFHDTAQAVTDDIMRYRSITLNWRHFDDTWERIKTCDLKQIHKKRAKVPYRFKGHKSAGLCAESVELHDSMHIIYVGLLFSTRGNQID